MSKLVRFFLTLLAAPALAQEPVPTPRVTISYDGCNTMTCDPSTGSCSTTILACSWPRNYPVLLPGRMPSLQDGIIGQIQNTPAEPVPPTLWDYLRQHVSIVSGVASANGERSEFVSLALDDSFQIRPKLTGFGNLSLFGRQRVQGIAGAPLGGSDLPTSLDDLALYSAGEITTGAFFQAHEKVAIECRGAMTFAMTGLTGTVGDPVDSSKFTFGCGPRVSGSVGRLSVIFGHSGPVDEGAKWYGFIPSTVYDGAFRLTDTTSFLVFVAAGRDLGTNKAVTSARFSVRKAFR